MNNLDPLAAANLARAQSLIASALGGQNNEPTQVQKAAAFIQYCAEMAAVESSFDVGTILRQSKNALVAKAAIPAISSEGVYGDGSGELADAWLASVAELSILDTGLKYAKVLPRGIHHAKIATMESANVVGEGQPKPLNSFTLNSEDTGAIKAVAMIVITSEVLRRGGAAGVKLFEDELRASVTRGTNRAVLDSLVDSSTLDIPSYGDALADLRAGIAAAGPSYGYVIAADSGLVADLATRVENRGGMGVRGGSFCVGVDVVAVDGLAGIRVIPASRLVIADHGMTIRHSDVASVEMRDDPAMPAEMVSLWQTNSRGILAERSFELSGDCRIVAVGAES